MNSNSITLEAVRTNSLPPFPKITQSFDNRGACVGIGRNQDNDLVLPDDEFVSGYHANIKFENNCFLLSDTSTNGTGIDNRDNLVHRDTVVLQHGNRLIIGEYEILVSINHDTPADQSDATPAYPSDSDITRIETTSSIGNSETEQEQEQTDSPWDAIEKTSEYLPDGGETASSSWSTGLPGEEPINPPTTDRKPDNSEDVPENIEDILFPPEVTNPPKISKEEIEPEEPMPVIKKSDPTLEAATSDVLLRAFLDGAGLGDRITELDDPTATLQLAGSMLRVMVEEMKKLLLGRAEMQRDVGAEGTIMEATGVSQIKFSVSADQALELLLIAKRSGFLEPLDAVKSGFRDVENHQQATIDATRVALEEILMRFAPQHYEDKFKEGFMFNKVRKIWNAYKDAYSKNVAEAKQDIFGADFAKAYNEKKRLLKDLNQN